MKNDKSTYIKNIIFPCLIFSILTGIFTGILIFLFKAASTHIFNISAYAYSYVRACPALLPCLVLGAAALGLLSASILKHSKNCRGGGIPTSVAILRGLIEFKWLNSIFHLFASALITFLGGVPLGNEGPSVQMGTAVGRGTVRVFARKHKAWDRYIMTGGACGGFAVATGAPLTGIFFAFEEAHRRFSPMLFMTAAMTVVSATSVMRLLCEIFGISPYMFEFNSRSALPLKYLWIAAVIGIICGLAAVLFTKLYAAIGKLLSERLKKLPFTLKIVIIFALVAVFGFFSSGFMGTGHGLIDELIHGNGVWYLLILYFCVRAIFLMLANHAGISGGIFVPTLAFGAMIGALCSKLAIQMGILPAEYYVIPIITGMASFLSASSRTPITATTFALEALSGLSNILPITIGVTIAFLVIETCGITSLHDIVIAQKTETFNEGKISVVVDISVTVARDSFAVGKEVRDILWPPSCTVLSITKAEISRSAHEAGTIDVGDILELHYQTHSPKDTFAAIEAIVGEQKTDKPKEEHTVDENEHIVPEI